MWSTPVSLVEQAISSGQFNLHSKFPILWICLLLQCQTNCPPQQLVKHASTALQSNPSPFLMCYLFCVADQCSGWLGLRLGCTGVKWRLRQERGLGKVIQLLTQIASCWLGLRLGHQTTMASRKEIVMAVSDYRTKEWASNQQSVLIGIWTPLQCFQQMVWLHPLWHNCSVWVRHVHESCIGLMWIWIKWICPL